MKSPERVSTALGVDVHPHGSSVMLTLSTSSLLIILITINELFLFLCFFVMRLNLFGSTLFGKRFIIVFHSFCYQITNL